MWINEAAKTTHVLDGAKEKYTLIEYTCAASVYFCTTKSFSTKNEYKAFDLS